MPFRSRTLSILVLTFLLASLFAGCLPQSNGSQKTLTIAVVEDNPGTEQNANSQSIYAGVKLAASQVNAAKKNIRVVVELYDDGNDPVQAAQQASKVVDGKAVAVIGHSSIETGLAASDDFVALLKDSSLISVIARGRVEMPICLSFSRPPRPA